MDVDYFLFVYSIYLTMHVVESGQKQQPAHGAKLA